MPYPPDRVRDGIVDSPPLFTRADSRLKHKAKVQKSCQGKAARKAQEEQQRFAGKHNSEQPSNCPHGDSKPQTPLALA